MAKVIVFGGSGNVGLKLVKYLVKHGADVRVFCRHECEPLTNLGVETVHGDMLNPKDVEKALRHVDKVYLLNPVHPTEFAQAMIVFNLCKQMKIKHLVYQSVISPENFKDVPHFASKLAVENAIREFGQILPFTIIRPAYYMQNDFHILEVIVGKNLYVNPLDDLSILQIDTNDVAEFAAHVLLSKDSEHYGKTYTLHNPKRMNGDEMASVWSQALDKKVVYVSQDLDSWEKQMEKAIPPWMVFDLRVMYEALRERGVASNPKNVKTVTEILGRSLHTYEDFVNNVASELE